MLVWLIAPKKIASVCCYLTWFWTNISQVFAVGKSSLPVILSTISIALIIAFFSNDFLTWLQKASYLDWVGFYLWRSTLQRLFCYSRQGKRSSLSHFLLSFLQCLGSSYLSTLGSGPSLQRRFCSSLAGTAVNDTSSVTATASAWDSLYHTNTLEFATIVKLTRTLAIIPITLPLLLAKPSTRQQPRSKLKILPCFDSTILASLLTTVLTSLVLAQLLFHLSNSSPNSHHHGYECYWSQTNLVATIKSSGKSILLGALCWIVIIRLVLACNYSSVFSKKSGA